MRQRHYNNKKHGCRELFLVFGESQIDESWPTALGDGDIASEVV